MFLDLILFCAEIKALLVALFEIISWVVMIVPVSDFIEESVLPSVESAKAFILLLAYIKALAVLFFVDNLLVIY